MKGARSSANRSRHQYRMEIIRATEHRHRSVPTPLPLTLNVNCPHCGRIHAVSVRETYIDDAIRDISEIARQG